MSNGHFKEGRSGSVLDELGLDRPQLLELKLKAQLHQRILYIARQRHYTAKDLKRILHIQQPRVSELMRGKLSTLSVARFLLYVDLLGATAHVNVRLKAKKKSRARVAA